MKTTRALLTGAVLTFSSAVQASLIGDTVTCNFNSATNSLVCSTPSAVVLPAAPEFTLDLVISSSPRFSVDIGASSIAISMIGGGNTTFGAASQVLVLGSLDDSGGDIAGIANFTTLSTTGIDLSDVSFTADSVSFTFTQSGWVGDASASFDLVIAGAAPEPFSLALVGLGLAGLGLMRGRKYG